MSINMEGLAFPKKSRIKNQETINQNKREKCEICGKWCNNEPHHIISRGAGGPDIPENMIQLCKICHRKAHNGEYDKMWLFNIISRRLKKKRKDVIAIIEQYRPIINKYKDGD